MPWLITLFIEKAWSKRLWLYAISEVAYKNNPFNGYIHWHVLTFTERL